MTASGENSLAIDTQPAIATTVDTIDDWQTHIAAGTGFGVTPESTAWLHPHPEIRYIPLTDAPTVPVHLVWAPNNPHPGLADFIRLAHEVVHRYSTTQP